MCSVSAGTPKVTVQMDLWLGWQAKGTVQGSRLWGPFLHPVMYPFIILVMEIGVQISSAFLFLENCFLRLRDEGLEHCHPGHLLPFFFSSEPILGSLAR